MSKAYIKCKLPVLTKTNEAVCVMDNFKKPTWVPLSICSVTTIALLETFDTRGEVMDLDIQEWKAKQLGVL